MVWILALCVRIVSIVRNRIGYYVLVSILVLVPFAMCVSAFVAISQLHIYIEYQLAMTTPLVIALFIYYSWLFTDEDR